MLVPNPEQTPVGTRRIFNILAEDRDVVAKFLTSNIVKTKGTNTFIPFLTPMGVALRFVTAFTRKNRFFDENGKLKEKYATQW